jgi:hypothetical protein
MRRWIVLLLLAAMACTTDGGPQPPPDPGPGPAQSNEPAPELSGTVEADPGVKVEGKCVRTPAEHGDQDVLEADVQVQNTGNIGVKVRVIAVWPRQGHARTAVFDVAQVKEGETAPLHLRLDVSGSEAQSITHAVDQGRKCHLRRHIIGAFGLPSG